MVFLHVDVPIDYLSLIHRHLYKSVVTRPQVRAIRNFLHLIEAELDRIDPDCQDEGHGA